MGSLVSSLISDPLQWHLSLSISDRDIDLHIRRIDGDDSVISRQIQLNSDTLSALEDAVYDNPLLLSDFGQTDVLIDTERYMLIPTEAAETNDICSLLIDKFWPGDPLTSIMYDIKDTPYTLIAAIDHKLHTFIRRTFTISSVIHRICPFIDFCVSDSKGFDGAKMYVDIHGVNTDIAFVRKENLLKANTFATSAITDILYYMMLMASTLKFDSATDEISISGDEQARNELIPMLRKYFGSSNIKS